MKLQTRASPLLSSSLHTCHAEFSSLVLLPVVAADSTDVVEGDVVCVVHLQKDCLVAVAIASGRLASDTKRSWQGHVVCDVLPRDSLRPKG